jgi:hypothetical protein
MPPFHQKRLKVRETTSWQIQIYQFRQRKESLIANGASHYGVPEDTNPAVEVDFHYVPLERFVQSNRKIDGQTQLVDLLETEMLTSQSDRVPDHPNPRCRPSCAR